MGMPSLSEYLQELMCRVFGDFAQEGDKFVARPRSWAWKLCQVFDGAILEPIEDVFEESLADARFLVASMGFSLAGEFVILQAKVHDDKEVDVFMSHSGRSVISHGFLSWRGGGTWGIQCTSVSL